MILPLWLNIFFDPCKRGYCLSKAQNEVLDLREQADLKDQSKPKRIDSEKPENELRNVIERCDFEDVSSNLETLNYLRKPGKRMSVVKLKGMCEWYWRLRMG